ncbi:hypothetical protein GDO81_021319 [Engystomops pustulosus]|uniref:KRAB domain-containing protein n=1 Tax=Engystomops pustulosus TaxID=76066 RepID=A0AAV6ZQ17_ENGPU|nr:hypothetical protein GDO81_021319 [Engystomops pustulosus]
MYLLTGEVYLIIKKLGDRTSVPHVSEGLIQHALTLPSPYSEESENSDQKILDLTKTIIALLTREVPIRCQDVTVYFSMEEWEYIEEHKDEYKDLLMENRHSLTSLGGSSRRSPEPQTHPGICHYNPETRTEKPNGSQVMVTDGLTKRIKVETEDDRYRRNYPDRCKEEVVPVAFYPEASSNRNTSPGSSASPHLSYKTEADFTQRSSPESIYEDLLTFTERRRMNERILELTMEIIDLLSKGVRDDYVIV